MNQREGQMSYERQNSMSRLEQYRARQADRIEAINRAIDEGRTTVVSSGAPVEEIPRRRVHLTAVHTVNASMGNGACKVK